MRELELKIKIGMEILSPSLIRFHISTLLLSNSPCMVLRAYFSLSRPFGVLTLALLREAVHSFLQGVLFVFPRQCAVTVFYLLCKFGRFWFSFLDYLNVPFCKLG